MESEVLAALAASVIGYIVYSLTHNLVIAVVSAFIALIVISLVINFAHFGSKADS